MIPPKTHKVPIKLGGKCQSNLDLNFIKSMNFNISLTLNILKMWYFLAAVCRFTRLFMLLRLRHTRHALRQQENQTLDDSNFVSSSWKLNVLFSVGGNIYFKKLQKCYFYREKFFLWTGLLRVISFKAISSQKKSVNIWWQLYSLSKIEFPSSFF